MTLIAAHSLMLCAHASNFNNMTADPLLRIQFYLQHSERARMRHISRMSNFAYQQHISPVITAINRSRFLVGQYEDSKGSLTDELQCFKDWQVIHKKFILNARYAAEWPLFIRVFPYKKRALTEANLAEESHIQRLVALSSMIHSLCYEANDSRLLFFKLGFRACWSYLQTSSETTLPPLDHVFYLDDNEPSPELNYLRRLIDDFGLIVFHDRFLNTRWNQWQIDSFNEFASFNKFKWRRRMGMVMFDQAHFDRYYLEVAMFNAEWFISVLHNVNATSFEEWIHIQYDEEFTTEQNLQLFQETVQYLGYHGEMRVLHRLMKALHANGLLRLLRHCDFSDVEWYGVNLTNFVRVAFRTVRQSSSVNTVHLQREEIVGLGSALWDKFRNNESMAVLKELTREPLFDPALIRDIINTLSFLNVHFGESHGQYLETMVVTLCHVRQDWDVDNLGYMASLCNKYPSVCQTWTS